MLRISLRPPHPSDAETIDGWLTEAVDAVKGVARGRHESAPQSLSAFLSALRPNWRAFVIERERQAIGIVVEYLEGQGPARIEFLAIAEPFRNLGFGAEAVLTVEALHPGRSLVAGVPLSNGLAIYFWLHMGYAPLYPRPSAGILTADRLWMGRFYTDGLV